MQIIAKCPGCGHSWLLEAGGADRRIKCPKCHKLFKIPNLDEVPKAKKVIKQAKDNGKPSQFCGDEFWIWGSSISRIEGIDKELIDTAVMSGTGSYDRPGSLTPTHTGPTTRALSHSTKQVLN